MTIAGIGNVYADEILFQAGCHPAVPADRLPEDQAGSLFKTMRRVLRTASDRGGAINQLPDGWLLPHRDDKGECPRCAGRLSRTTVGGRTTLLCPSCQPKP